MANYNTLETIVSFKIGRGGHFHNPGYHSFDGIRDINYYTDSLYLDYENASEVYNKIKHYPNILEKWEEARDYDDYSFFTDKLGFDLGEKMYFDGGGNPVELTEDQASTGCGFINLDNGYDSIYSLKISELEDHHIGYIKNSDYKDHYEGLSVVETYLSQWQNEDVIEIAANLGLLYELVDANSNISIDQFCEDFYIEIFNSQEEFDAEFQYSCDYKDHTIVDQVYYVIRY